MSISDLIRDKEQAAQLWQMPNFDSGHSGKSYEELAEEEEQIQPLTAEELEAIQQEAYQEGFVQGENDGLAAAKEKIAQREAELNRTREELQQLFETVQQPLQRLDETLSQQVCQLAISIAERIVRADFSSGSEALLPMVREALQRLPGADQQQSTLYLNPEDVALIEHHFEPTLVRVRADATMSRGGARLESGSARIDMSIEEQIRAIAAEIFEE
ncbi:hypothetical protein D5085_08790 [Ectothiorhodospiraceae bacterium BW-2]|nr:hypothetical protein D5085_08790 [Ectothiorhodospiraceae bacterium BW-2]